MKIETSRLWCYARSVPARVSSGPCSPEGSQRGGHEYGLAVSPVGCGDFSHPEVYRPAGSADESSDARDLHDARALTRRLAEGGEEGLDESHTAEVVDLEALLYPVGLASEYI